MGTELTKSQIYHKRYYRNLKQKELRIMNGFDSGTAKGEDYWRASFGGVKIDKVNKTETPQDIKIIITKSGEHKFVSFADGEIALKIGLDELEVFVRKTKNLFKE